MLLAGLNFLAVSASILPTWKDDTSRQRTIIEAESIGQKLSKKMKKKMKKFADQSIHVAATKVTSDI